MHRKKPTVHDKGILSGSRGSAQINPLFKSSQKPLFGDLLLHGDRTLPNAQLGNMSGSLGLPQNPCCSPATSIPRALCIHKDVCAMQFCVIDPTPTASINLWRLGARNERHALRQPAVASRCVSSMPAPPGSITVVMLAQC